MGWSIGFDPDWKRDIGYGVPAVCDHPDCGEAIDRGLGCVCGSDPYGGEHGCGLYFCGKHLAYGDVEGEDRCVQLCERCHAGKGPFEPTPDTAEWLEWKLTDESWADWRLTNPVETAALLSKQQKAGAGHRS
jgi:hypothetical protein